MDLTPKLLTDIEFPMWWRGYKPEDVDEFLERVAVGVGELQQLVAELRDRAAAAEHRLLERSDEDEIRRTLVMAQRTAEASLSEARAEAERLLDDAQARASALDAEVDERRRTELGALAERRAALESDIDELRAFVDRERGRLLAAMGEHVDWLTTSFVLQDAPTPTAPVEEVRDTVMPAAPTADDDEIDDVDEQPGPSGLRSASENLADALRRAGLEDLVAEGAGESTGPHDVVEDDDSEPAWRETAASGDDPFLAELRRAVSDPEPLGPRDHDVTGGAVAADDGDAGGFLRRRRRA